MLCYELFVANDLPQLSRRAVLDFQHVKSLKYIVG